jgi:multiple sugar transport system substrate-binding protein
MMKRRHCSAGGYARRALGAGALLVSALQLIGSTAAASASPATRTPNHINSSSISGSIDYMYWGDTVRTAHTNAVIKDFEKAYPHVTVTGEVIANFTNYWQKVTTEAATGTLPCVTQTQSRELTEYTSSNVFRNLQPVVKSGAIEVSGMPKAVLATGMVHGQLYMIPYGAAYFGLFYNDTLLSKLGVSVPHVGTSWTSFESWLSELRKKLPTGLYPIANEGQQSDTFTAYVESSGQKLFNAKGQLGFSASLLKQYWQMWLTLQKEKIALPESLMAQEGPNLPQSFLIEKKVVVEAEPGNELQNAQTAASEIHTGTISVMLYPYGPAGNGNILVTNGLSIPTRGCTGKDLQAAEAFINFFTNNPVAAKAFASQNGAVTDTSLLAQQINSPATPEPVRKYLEAYQYVASHNPPLETYPPGFTIVFDTLFPEIFQKIADGQEPLSAGVSSFMAQAKVDLSA